MASWLETRRSTRRWRSCGIADMLYQVPANPPTTDLTVFLRDVPLELD
jgi:hypothetical protein